MLKEDKQKIINAEKEIYLGIIDKIKDLDNEHFPLKLDVKFTYPKEVVTINKEFTLAEYSGEFYILSKANIDNLKKGYKIYNSDNFVAWLYEGVTHNKHSVDLFFDKMLLVKCKSIFIFGYLAIGVISLLLSVLFVYAYNNYAIPFLSGVPALTFTELSSYSEDLPEGVISVCAVWLMALILYWGVIGVLLLGVFNAFIIKRLFRNKMSYQGLRLSDITFFDNSISEKFRGSKTT